MKPHITKSFCIWICRSAGRIGAGLSPRSAYRDWKEAP